MKNIKFIALVLIAGLLFTGEAFAIRPNAPKISPLPVTRGGTGATSAATARTALGVADSTSSSLYVDQSIATHSADNSAQHGCTNIASATALSHRGIHNGQLRWVSTHDIYSCYTRYLQDHQFVESVTLRQCSSLLTFLHKQQSLLDTIMSNRGSSGGADRVYRPTKDLPPTFLMSVLARDPYVAAMFDGLATPTTN